MKLKTYLLTATLMLFVVTSFGQSKGTLYKSGEWLDTKGKGGWINAMKDPNYEKVEILQTDKSFKVTLGSKFYDYQIFSTNRFSDVMMQYNVKFNDKSYVINVAEQSPGNYSINIDGEWMVYKITNITTVEIK